MKRPVFRWLGLITLFIAVLSIAAGAGQQVAAAENLPGQISTVDNLIRSSPDNQRIVQVCPSNRTPCLLRAIPSQTKGKVSLSWRSNGIAFRGSFLVERSTNRSTWSAVSACGKTPTSATRYYCTDSYLRSGTIYYYRACAVTSGFRCGTIYLTPVTSVRVP
jgi:hypothetical protein